MDIDPAIIRVMDNFGFPKSLAKKIVKAVRDADQEAHSWFDADIEWCPDCGKPKNLTYTKCRCDR